MNDETTGFVGLTHLGIVSSICWAFRFPHVIGFDADKAIIEELISGRIPVKEPKLQEIFDKAIHDITFTTDFSRLSECNTIFITQDIRTDEENRSDYDSFYNLIEKTIDHLANGTRIVLMSQISVGTCSELNRTIRNKRPELDFDLFYMVETLIIGNAVERYLHPERIILGTGSGTEADLYKHDILKNRLKRFGAPLLIMKFESAELTKLAINFYLFNSVTYANTVADLCEAYGADMNEIIPALRLDKRIGQHAYIQPGLGIAGGNLERDMMTLKKLEEKKDISSQFIDTLIDLNRTRYRWVEQKLHTHLFQDIRMPEICIWGIAYKKDTASMKNSISSKLIHDLSGRAAFSAYDPLVKAAVEKNVRIGKDRYDAVRGAHCLIILTDPEEFKSIDVKKLKALMKYPLIIDCVNLYSKIDDFKDLKYIAIGRAHQDDI